MIILYLSDAYWDILYWTYYKKNYTLVYFKNLERSAHKSNTTVKTRISIPRAPT